MLQQALQTLSNAGQKLGTLAGDRNTKFVLGCSGFAVAVLGILPTLGIVVPPLYAGLIVLAAAVVPSRYVSQTEQEIVDLYSQIKIDRPDIPTASQK